MKNSIWNAINLRNAKVTYDAFTIDLSKSPASQLDYLDEDLIQMNYGDDYTIDVGWYPSGAPSGFLRIVVIEGYNWDKPLFSKRVANLIWFPKVLQEAIDFADDCYRKQQSKAFSKK